MTINMIHLIIWIHHTRYSLSLIHNLQYRIQELEGTDYFVAELSWISTYIWSSFVTVLVIKLSYYLRGFTHDFKTFHDTNYVYIYIFSCSSNKIVCNNYKYWRDKYRQTHVSVFTYFQSACENEYVNQSRFFPYDSVISPKQRLSYHPFTGSTCTGDARQYSCYRCALLAEALGENGVLGGVRRECLVEWEGSVWWSKKGVYGGVRRECMVELVLSHYRVVVHLAWNMWWRYCALNRYSIQIKHACEMCTYWVRWWSVLVDLER